MKRILLTGMSATGKSTITAELVARGYRAVDLDQPAWSEYRAMPEPTEPFESDRDWVWREDRVERLLMSDKAEVLFVSGCASNQVKFYGRFDEIILLTAPVDVVIERLSTRTTNNYGKRPEELEQVLYYQRTVEPLLRQSASAEIDTSATLEAAVAAVLALAV